MKPVVILVSPQGDANVGGIARLMANFDLSDLRIINPRCDLKSDLCRMMSLKAYPILEKAKIFSSLESAQRDLRWSFAFSAIELGQRESPSYELPEFIRTKLSSISLEEAWAFVFGREDRGLEREELAFCDGRIRIPSSNDYDSLNLSSAVAVALSHWYASAQSKKQSTSSRSDRPKKEDEEIFFEGLTKFLEHIGFLNLKTSKHILLDLRDMYHRAEPRARDLRILFGILADLEYKFKKKFFRN